MSSTNRGGKKNEFEFYPTPPVSVEGLLAHWQPPGLRLLEPGAGDGAIVRTINRWQNDRGLEPYQWTLVEIDPKWEKSLRRSDPSSVIKCPQDFLTWKPASRFDAAVGNPPFTLACEFIDHCRRWTDTVVMLQRLGFLATDDRYAWWRSVGPFDVGVLANRPFPDSADYAWYIFSPMATNRIFHIHNSDGIPSKQLSLLEVMPMK